MDEKLNLTDEQLAILRNKMSPFKNLITIIKCGKLNESEIKKYIEREVDICEKLLNDICEK